MTAPMENWLCDTNVISELMRRHPDAGVVDWLRQREWVHLSVITVEEIAFGLTRRNLTTKAAWFEKFASARCQVHAVDEAIARRAGQIRANLASSGRTRSQADCLIGATAWAHGLVVVTRNTADFADTGVPVFNPFPPPGTAPA